MLTIKQAAANLQRSEQRIRQLCKAGRIPGAQRMGRDWIIPEPLMISKVQRKRRATPSSVDS